MTPPTDEARYGPDALSPEEAAAYARDDPDEARAGEPRTAVEAVDRALLYVLALPDRDYRALMGAMAAEKFVSTLRLDGYEIVEREAAAAPALDVAAEVAYEMKVFLHGAKMAPPVAPGWLQQIEKWYARLSEKAP